MKEKMEGIELELSVSRCKTYKDCPRKYFYTYIDKLPRKDWDHFDIGKLVHGTLEALHNVYKTDLDKPENLASFVKDCFLAQIDFLEKEKKSSFSDTVINEAKSLVRNYLLYLKNSNGIKSKIVVNEEYFNIKLNDKYSFQGFVDRLDRDTDDFPHIKDYKTNKNAKYMDPFQLKAYGIYLQNKFPNVDFFRGSYIMLRHLNDLPFTFNLEDINKVKKELISFGDSITQDQKWTPRPSKLCDWCDFKSTCLNNW